MGFFCNYEQYQPYLFFGWPEVLYVQQVPPPVILTILVSRAAIGPERAVSPVSEHPYIHQEYQHVGRGQSETDVGIYINTILVSRAAIGPERAVSPVSEHPYIHQEYQHVGRGQSETDVGIYINTILVSRAAIGPERAVSPVSEHPYIHQEYQHVGRRQSETDVSLYTQSSYPGQRSGQNGLSPQYRNIPTYTRSINM